MLATVAVVIAADSMPQVPASTTPSEPFLELPLPEVPFCRALPWSPGLPAKRRPAARKLRQAGGERKLRQAPDFRGVTERHLSRFWYTSVSMKNALDRSAAAKKAAGTRKRRATAKKAAATKESNLAAKKRSATAVKAGATKKANARAKKRREAGLKASETRKRNSAMKAPVESQVEPTAHASEPTQTLGDRSFGQR